MDRLKTLLEARIKYDTLAVPFRLIRNVMTVLPYGSNVKILFMLLALTGCRIKETQKMRMSMIRKHPHKEGWGLLYWKCGKNQTGFRCEELPPFFLEELKYNKLHYRGFQDRLVSPSPESFRKYFNLYRADMLPEWREMWEVPSNAAVRIEYLYNGSGLRKTFTTLHFAKELKKWKSPDIALEMVSKRLKHSCTHMTAHHYLKNFEHLEIEKYEDMEIWEILKQPLQRKISDYGLEIREQPLSMF